MCEHRSLRRRRLVPVVGVIYALFFGVAYPPNGAAPAEPSGHLFTAIRDRGAFISTDGGNLEYEMNSFWNLAGEIGSRNGKNGMVHGVGSLGR